MPRAAKKKKRARPARPERLTEWEWVLRWDQRLQGTRCPITGERFFAVIEHPSRGFVPTYGGPFDSYTIPERDDEHSWSREHYDHDEGGWVDGCAAIQEIVVDREEYESLLEEVEALRKKKGKRR